MKPMRFCDVTGAKIYFGLIDCPNLPSKDDVVTIEGVKYLVLSILWEAVKGEFGLTLMPTDVVLLDCAGQ